MKKKFRSTCPIASTLDILGDKWSFIIVRDMLFMGKKTYKELSLSKEKIATGILASRLKKLEAFGFITKRKLPTNQKENIYLLTQKGLDLAPTLLEISLWGDKYMREYNIELDTIDEFKADKNSIIEKVHKNYRSIVEQTIG